MGVVGYFISHLVRELGEERSTYMLHLLEVINLARSVFIPLSLSIRGLRYTLLCLGTIYALINECEQTD